MGGSWTRHSLHQEKFSPVTIPASAVAFRKAVFIDSKDLSPQAARSINLVNRQTNTGQVQLSQDTSPPVQTSTDSSQQSGLASDLHPEDAGAQGYGHREES